ncbi:MAG TPA: transcriptional regulator FilR1 domain-containing protein [Methanosarcina sp.]|nr:transcriptional regulator FilR1 domain-containing protein [Methanosarcina sp.]
MKKIEQKRRNRWPSLKLYSCATEPAIERLLIINYGETNRLIEVENSKLFVYCRNVNLPVLIVTDRFMAMEFFRNDKRLSNQLIMCSGKEALHWGKNFTDIMRRLQNR